MADCDYDADDIAAYELQAMAEAGNFEQGEEYDDDEEEHLLSQHELDVLSQDTAPLPQPMPPIPSPTLPPSSCLSSHLSQHSPASAAGAHCTDDDGGSRADEGDAPVTNAAATNAHGSDPNSAVGVKTGTDALRQLGEKKHDAHLFVFTADKAGMGSVDKAHVARVVSEMSKGSAFESHARAQAERTGARIRELLRRKAQYTTAMSAATRSASSEGAVDNYIRALEQGRDLSRTFAMVDMDAFFAAVEQRDNPELASVEFAVGGMGMISTANYLARRHGVRSAMPGFIARALCPQLRFVKPNMQKYKMAAELARGVFREYDPNFCAVSVDEALLDITDCVRSKLDDVGDVDGGTDGEWERNGEGTLADSEFVHIGRWRAAAAAVVHELRSKVKLRTGGLTCSAGVACNSDLAKICSDMNKPDGQYLLPPTRRNVLAFMRALPVRKLRGVGKVTERVLEALHISVCNELHEQRRMLWCVLPDDAKWLIRAALGFGDTRTTGRRLDDHAKDTGGFGRKSIGVERTFSTLQGRDALFDKCRQLVATLLRDMQKHSVRARQLTLKLKDTQFRLWERSTQLEGYSCNAATIEKAAFAMLDKELEQAEGCVSKVQSRLGLKNDARTAHVCPAALKVKTKTLSLRLMGLRVSRFETAHNEDNKAVDGQQMMSKYIAAGASSTNDAATSSATDTGVEESAVANGAHGAGEVAAGCPVCGHSWAHLGLSFDGQQSWQHEQHVNDCLSRSEVRRVQREENDSVFTPFPKRQRKEVQVDMQRGARSGGTSREQLRRTHQVKLTAFMGSPFGQL